MGKEGVSHPSPPGSGGRWPAAAGFTRAISGVGRPPAIAATGSRCLAVGMQAPCFPGELSPRKRRRGSDRPATYRGWPSSELSPTSRSYEPTVLFFSLGHWCFYDYLGDEFVVCLN
jgi:hypothetical protein